MRRLPALAMACALSLAVTAAPAAAASTTLVDCGSGAKLKAAIDAAGPGDTLRIEGTCVGQFVVDEDLTLEGTGDDPTLDGAITIQPPPLTGMTVNLSGLRVTGSVAAAEGSTMTIRDAALGGLDVGPRSQVEVRDSSVSDGVGIRVHGPITHVRLYGSTVSRNRGPGIDLSYQGTVSLFDSTVRDNRGVGIRLENTGLTLDHSTVRGNAGGGIRGSQYLEIRNGSRIVDNHSSGDGGGIAWDPSGFSPSTSLTIRDSEVSGNTAAGDGGGVHIVGERTALLDDVIIRKNTAGGSSGGIFAADDVVFGEFSDVTFSGNTPNDCTGCPLTVKGVSASDIGRTTATITWKVSEKATGQVEYGTTTAYGDRSEKETSHEFAKHVQRLSGLEPGTEYHYRVRSATADGRSVTSDDHAFTTLSPPPPVPCPAPELASPADGATIAGHVVTLDWRAIDGCRFGHYQLRVRTTPDMSADALSLVETTTQPDTTVWSGRIDGHEDEDLYWAVRAVDAPDGSSWADARVFRIVAAARTTRVVDDLDSGFTHGGRGWHTSASGFRDHLRWASPSGTSATRWGEWRARLQGGRYRVSVYVPSGHATTHSAAYRVYAKGGSVVVRVNQRLHHDQWLRLGDFEFGSTGTVRLTSATGEAMSSGRQVAFDAVRFVPIGPTGATGSGQQDKGH